MVGGEEVDKSPFDYYSADLDAAKIPKRSRKELAMLHRAARQGDSGAWEELWLHGTKLVLKIAHSFREKGLLEIPFEEAVAEGNLAIGEALGRWNPRKSAFGTWVWIRVRGAILSENRRELNGGLSGILEEAPNIISDTFQHANGEKAAMENSILDLFVEDVDFTDDIVQDRLKRAVSDLPAREQMVVDLSYFLDTDLVQIAESMGVSPRMVRKIRDRAEQRIKNLGL